MEAVLKSRALSRNPRLTALLRYLCERCFRGQTTSIKEYDIATDVFARPADFDQTTDAIVRVEMHRLRKKLKEFYSSEGADQPIEIVIHNGNYIPEFVPREITDSKPDREEQLTRTEPILPSPVKTQIRISRRFIWAISAVVMMALAVVVLAMVARRHATTAPAAHLSPKPLVDAVAALPPEAGYRMLCGSTKGGYRDRQGHEWGPDAFFSGGTAVELPSQPIYRSRDASLFRSLRSGEFSYKIPLRPGTYELRLYFADTSYSPGTAMEGGENVRVFNVLINGLPALRDFDIIADAGPSTGYVRVFKDIHPATDGYLHLGFSKLSELPLINAIEITPGIPGHLRPTRIVTQDNVLTDRNGLTWYPDNFFLGGRMLARFGDIAGADDPRIYERERYGRFSYAIPVASGRYAVSLHFAETYWGPDGQGGGGTGSRIFDVYCNGVALLRNFDMLQEAGSHRQLTRTFHNLQPNAQGNLLLSFVPVKNYATISAIEVIDETP